MTVVQCVWRSSKKHQDGGCILLLWHRLNSPVPGHRRNIVHSPQDPTASLLVPFCMLAFDVTVPALLAHTLKQMFSASARSVCNWHSSAGRLLSKSFQWWKGAGGITTIISTSTNLFGNTAGSKPGSAADEEGKICSYRESFWSFELQADAFEA